MQKQPLYILITCLFILLFIGPVHGEEGKTPTVDVVITEQPVLKLQDDLHRDTPRSTITHFFKALSEQDYETANEYLDFRYLPRTIENIPPEALTKKLKIILDRAAWIDLAALSDDSDGYEDDNLPAYREFLTKVKLSDTESVDLLLQKVPGEKGFQIWKFSNRTVAQIPAMYEIHGYTDFEQKFVDIFPDYEVVGWQIWQWIIAFVIVIVLFIALSIPLWGISFFVKRQNTHLTKQISSLIMGPIRFTLLAYVTTDIVYQFVTPSSAIRAFTQLQTIRLIVILWIIFALIDIGKDLIAKLLEQRGIQSSSVLLGPAKTMLRILMIIFITLIWLDNMGMSITTILTGLGVGGFAFALAAQDTLKNLIGSVIILLDKPFAVGQRIVVAGHDGEVEEIGLRSTRLRLLNGHQTIIPNELMARSDIENIERRPHIRRRDHIGLPYDTPLDKIKKAVEIIRGILDNHEGMAEDKPPQVHFESFKDDHINIVMFYWYHPALYWDYLAFNQKVNEAIMAQFAAEGIRFALPTERIFIEK